MIEKEIWKPIKGFEYRYDVSNKGRVRSRYANKITILKIRKHKCGNNYIQYNANLYKDKKQKSRIVSRLVAQAFIPNPENKLHVNHIDFDTSNNCVDNLEWATPKENFYHSYEAGRITVIKGKRYTTLKMQKDYKRVIALYEFGLSSYEISRVYDCAHSSVLEVLKKNGIKRRNKTQRGR